jgi:uncharacterized protein (TIGR02231 family)
MNDAASGSITAFRTSALGAALLAGASLIAINGADAATIEAKSAVSGVVLYPDAAIVTRELTVEVPQGEHEIILPDLPATLDPASLRVEGSAAARVTIGNVDIRARPAGGETSPETQQKLKALQASRDRVQDRIDATEGKKAMIQRMADGSNAQTGAGNSGKALDIENWSRAWDLVGKGLQGANEELRALRDEMTKIETEIAALESPAILPHPRPGSTARLAAIAIEAGAATKLTLTVAYRVGGASWRPVYDARLDTRGAKPVLDVTRRAMIRQNSGEDWREAKLTLSTLAVNRGTAAPVLGGERIAIFVPPPPRPAVLGRATAPVSPAPEASADMAMKQRTTAFAAGAPEERRIEAEEVSATINAGAYQSEFVVPGKVSLPSGNAEKSVRLGAEKPEATITVRAAPVLNPTAYLEASFKQGGETALLPGEVMLSRDGAFIGKGRLPLVAPGETARLGFGADERVTITRVPLSKQARQPGILSSNKTEEQVFRTLVRNLHGFPVTMQIEDRQPVSEDDAVTVERMSEMTKPDIEAPDDRRGVFAWTPVLKPQEERSFITAYRIRWPADKTTRITPLPR